MESSTGSARPRGSYIPSLRGRILLHGGIQLVGRTLNALGGVVVVWIVTRYLGLSGFGQYTFAASYVGLFSVFTDLGFQTIAVREMSREPERAPRIAGQLLILRAALSAGVLCVALAVLWLAPTAAFQPSGLRLAVVIAGIGMLFSPFLSVAMAVFQTSLDMTVPALADTLSRAVSLFLLGLAVALAAITFVGPEVRLWLVVGAACAGTVVAGLFAYQRAHSRVAIRLRLDRPLIGRMLRDGLPLAAFFLLGLINYRIDVVILSLMRGMSVVGQYGVATRLLDIALGGAGIFMGLAFPILSRRQSEDPALLQRAFQKAYDFMLTAGVAGAVFISALAPWIVPLVAGSHFRGSIVPVAIIAWAIPITFMETILTQMLVAANRQMSAVPIVVVAAAVNIGLNVALIPRLGASAPSLVTVVSDGLSAVGLLWLVHHTFGFGPSLSITLRIALTAGLTLAVLEAALRYNLFLAVPAGAAVFAAALIALKVVGPQDARVLMQRVS